jgi:DNA repair protein RadC
MKPREKLEKYWAQKLEWAELVATILWSGIKWLDVFKLSKKVFSIIELKKNNLKLEDLLQIKWIGKVKAMQIISAFELAKRYFVTNDIVIKMTKDVLDQVLEYRNKKQEYLLSITLDWANRLINKRVVTIWLLNQSLVHPREVFADAIEERANSIILVHNHPSWNSTPSIEDKIVTDRINQVAEIVWIKLIDHIIITKNDYFSFSENSML